MTRWFLPAMVLATPALASRPFMPPVDVSPSFMTKMASGLRETRDSAFAGATLLMPLSPATSSPPTPWMSSLAPSCEPRMKKIPAVPRT